MKSAKVSGQLLLQESADPYVSEARVLLKSDNCSASEVVEEAEKRLNFKQILGYRQCHRAGYLFLRSHLNILTHTENY